MCVCVFVLGGFFLGLFSIFFEILSDFILISANITTMCTFSVCVSMRLEKVKFRERKQTLTWVPVPGMHTLIFTTM